MWASIRAKWFPRLAVAIALVGAMTLASSGQAAQVPEKLAAILNAKKTIALDLGKAAENCVSRNDTDHVAFRGCIDWHSSVHGVWALIAIMRATETPRYDALVKAILSPKKIRSELRFLKRRPRFEMPYGRAWFLRLAIEYEAYYGRRDLRTMANYVLGSMLSYYSRRTINPTSGSYKSASWALVNMLDYARFIQDPDAQRKTIFLINKSFDFQKGSCDLGKEKGQFMAICTNIVMLAARVMDRASFASWVADYFGRVGIPRPVVKPVSWHHFGLNFSRAWGLWDAYALTGDSKYANAYADHFRATYEAPANWRGSYLGVGHWVPQFGVFALQPLFGETGRPGP